MEDQSLNSPSIFNWKKRYQIHQEFHQTTGNKIAHFLATPIQLFAIIKLFSFFYFYNPYLNLALLLILFLSWVYCSIHFKTGIIVSLYLFFCWSIASHYSFSTTPTADVLITMAILSFGIFVQVGIGHKIFEGKNANLSSEFAEFFETYNPMIFVLIFFFPFLDMLGINLILET